MTKLRNFPGFSLIEVVLAIVIMGLGSVVIVQQLPKVLSRGKSLSLEFVAQTLNRSSEAFIGTGGAFISTGTAQDALTLLQTPVDETSRKAGFGIFPVVDPSWTLQSATDDAPARLIYTYDPTRKRPTWSVATSGTGYIVITDKTRSAPTTADWTERVNAAGQVGARTSKWVYDFDDAPAATSSGSVIADTSYGTTTQSANLTINGPTSITTPGTYYWTGVASQAGTLTIIDADGTATQAANATSIQSSSCTVGAGESKTVTISLTWTGGTGGGTKTLTVDISVNVPAVPTLTLTQTNPDGSSTDLINSAVLSITTPGTYYWTATSSPKGEPFTLSVDSITVSAGGATTITSPSTTFSYGESKTVTVVAKAVNTSGTATKSLSISVDVPYPTGIWTVSVSGTGSYDSVTMTGTVDGTASAALSGTWTPAQVAAGSANVSVTLKPSTIVFTLVAYSGGVAVSTETATYVITK